MIFLTIVSTSTSTLSGINVNKGLHWGLKSPKDATGYAMIKWYQHTQIAPVEGYKNYNCQKTLLKRPLSPKVAIGYAMIKWYQHTQIATAEGS